MDALMQTAVRCMEVLVVLAVPAYLVDLQKETR
jgi:hypothetical protein